LIIKCIVVKCIVVKGCETPSNGNEVEIHYIGKSIDGRVFDSSRDSYKTFSFVVGENKVIDGWEIAIKTMKRGELSKFTMARELAKFTKEPELGKGEMGKKIPPYITLVYEIELFDWKFKDVTKKRDGGVRKRIITDGEGYDFGPNGGSTCEVSIIGKYNDRIFENRDVTFILGEGCDENIIEGVEIAIKKMKKKEKAELYIKPQYAFGNNGRKEFEIPDDYEEVVYEITLKNFERRTQLWAMQKNERFGIAEFSKTKGTKYFNESRFKLAIRQYKRIDRYIGSLNVNDDINLKRKKFDLLLTGHLNLALCYIKIEEFSNAIKQCDSALSINAKSQKGLYRRGLAYFGQKEYDLAIKDFNAVLELNPDNTSAQNELIACLNGLNAKIEGDKSTYRNMFENFAKKDVQVCQQLIN